MAEVRKPALHFRHRMESLLDEAQRAIRFLEARSVRCFDRNQKLRRIRFREKTAADDCHDHAREQQRTPDGRDDRRFRTRQAVVQRRTIVTMDHAHHSLQEHIAVIVALLLEDPAGKERNDEQGDQQ